MRTVFFHEDDYCQLEILPLTARGFCLKEIANIGDFSKNHQADFGFTDVYLLEDSAHKLVELALRPEQLDTALSFLPSYDRVETGYASQRVECTETHAKGNGRGQTVFWSVDKDGLVDAIWLDLWITPETKERWRDILTALGQLAPVLLADWCLPCCVNLTSAEEIYRYIKRNADE